MSQRIRIDSVKQNHIQKGNIPMGIKKTITSAALSAAMNYISGDPRKNLPKLLDIVENMGWRKNQVELLHRIVNDPENVWYKYLISLWYDVDNDILKTIFTNLGLNAMLFGFEEQQENVEKYGCNIPVAILLDPTSACNLHCTGCWDAEYGNRLNLTYDEMDSIVNQANELGCYFFLFSGGEPLVRKPKKDFNIITSLFPKEKGYKLFSVYTL